MNILGDRDSENELRIALSGREYGSSWLLITVERNVATDIFNGSSVK